MGMLQGRGYGLTNQAVSCWCMFKLAAMSGSRSMGVHIVRSGDATL